MKKSQSQSVQFKAWMAWLCAALFFGYQFALRVAPSVMTNELMASFAVGCSALGAISAYYYNAYAFLQIPAGSLLDRFGPRKMLFVAVSLCVLGTVCFAAATGTAQASFGRLLMGTGSAFGFLSCLKIGTLWFSPQKLPAVVGLSLCIGTAGAVGGSAPLYQMVQLFGWRNTIWILAAVGVVLLGLVLIFVKEKKKPLLEHKDKPKELESFSFLHSLKIILNNPQSWFISLHGILLYAPLAAFADMWGTKFIVDVYHIDQDVAALMSSLIYIGLGIGSPVLPLLVAWLKGYKPVMFLGTTGAIVMFSVTLFFTSMPAWLLSIALLSLGFFLGAQVLCFSIVCDINPREISATAGGFHNMVCMLSGVTLMPLVGKLLDRMAVKQGVYTPDNYMWALGTVLGAMLVGLFVVYWIKETYQVAGEPASTPAEAQEAAS